MKVKEYSITETGGEMNFITDKFNVRRTKVMDLKFFEISDNETHEILESSDEKYKKYFTLYWNYQLKHAPEVLVLNAEKNRYVRKGN